MWSIKNLCNLCTTKKPQRMLNKNQIKFIKSLSLKKYRDESGCFLAEGNKLVADLLSHFDC